MKKIIHDIVINEDENLIKKLRIRTSKVGPDKAIVGNTLILNGHYSNEFQRYYTIYSNKELKPGSYDFNKFELKVGNISLEAYSIFPATITIACCDVDWHIVDTEYYLLIVAPEGSTEEELVQKCKNLNYYKITGGSSNPLGNIVTFHLGELMDKKDYDFFGNYKKHFNLNSVIDAGRVTKALNDKVRELFPDYEVTPANNQKKIQKKDYIVYTFTQHDNWRRPYIDQLRRNTLLSQITVQYEFVTFDTNKHFNILHHIRSVELLTNIGKIWVEDENGNKWKVAIDWGSIDFPFQTGAVRGNYSENSGNSFTLNGVLRYFSIPKDEESFAVIKYIDTYLYTT
jgi:hypothetical protein